MPLQNRVTPDGTIVAHPARGTVMGNRGGCLHRPDKTLGARRWITRQWICCRLEFKHRHRQVMSPGRYTELFFLDEATALAAGHRPCFECRREEATEFARLWSMSTNAGRPSRTRATDIDRALHAERLEPDGSKCTWSAPLAELPDGTMIRSAHSAPYLVRGDKLLAWSPSGYTDTPPRPPVACVDVLTPPGTVDVLRRGYVPILHPTAMALAGTTR